MTAQPNFQTFSSTHFTFEYTAVDQASIAQTASRVEGEYSRILADLQVATMPLVRITLYTDHAAMVAATQATVGFVPATARGLITSIDHIHMMSPNLPEWGNYDSLVRDIVHEFAHCVSMAVNAAIPNNPRWLWESVAVYESGQFVAPQTLSYMTAHAPPSLASLTTIGEPRIYEIGYVVGEFVVSRWGQSGLRSLVLSGGNTQASLGLSQAEFESQWFQFVMQKYGI